MCCPETGVFDLGEPLTCTLISRFLVWCPDCQNPEWTVEEGQVRFPVCQPCEELHVMVFDHDDNDHDVVGRIWPPVHVRDLEYGVERHYSLQLHDIGEEFDFSTQDEKAKIKKLGKTNKSKEDNRGTISLSLRYDVVPTTQEDPAKGVLGKVLKSYLLWPRVPAKPIEILNTGVQKDPFMTYIPEHVYKELQRGMPLNFDLNFTMDLKQINHPKKKGQKLGYALPFGGQRALEANAARLKDACAPFAAFGGGFGSIMAWKSVTNSTMAVWCWSYLMFHPARILPMIISAAFLSMARNGWRRQNRDASAAEDDTFVADDDDEQPWDAREERRLWKIYHAPVWEDVRSASTFWRLPCAMYSMYGTTHIRWCRWMSTTDGNASATGCLVEVSGHEPAMRARSIL